MLCVIITIRKKNYYPNKYNIERRKFMKPLNKYIDHTLLKPDATEKQIIKLCNEAKEYDFFSVCLISSYVSLPS